MGGGKPKQRKPAGWYSTAAKAERREARQRRLAERAAREANNAEYQDAAAAAAQRRYEEKQRMLQPAIERAGRERSLNRPRRIGKVEPRGNENLTLYRARVGALKMASRRAEVLDRWSHKNDGTPETHEHASHTRQGALARLFQAGHIDVHELAWANEIAMVAESIERDVDVRCSSLEMRVDYSGSGRDALVENIMRVRREVAYTWWRERIPSPKRAVLDMIVGDAASYSTTALRYGMGKTKARKLLISAIQLWPRAMDHAESEVDDATLAAAHAGILGG